MWIRCGAAAFSFPIFRPALLSFTWQTPHRYLRGPYCSTTLLSTFCLCYRCSMLQSIVSSLAVYAPTPIAFLSNRPPSSLLLAILAVRLYPCLRDDLLVALMTGTHLPAVCRAYTKQRCFFPGLTRIKYPRNGELTRGSRLRSLPFVPLSPGNS